MDSSGDQIHSDQDNNQHFTYAMQLMGYAAVPLALQAAVQLDVFQTISAAGPDAKLSPQEIASRLAIPNPDAPMMLDRILRLLATHSVVTCSLDVEHQGGPLRLYGLAPVAKYFVRNEDGVSLVPCLNFNLDKVFSDCWSQMKETVIEGGLPFERAHGRSFFDYAAMKSSFNDSFNTTMMSQCTFVVKELLESYNGFEHLNQLVDVGGGLGVALSLITAKYPSIQGINFDLPHVVEHAPSYPGVQHVDGDMFRSVPYGDAIFMKWILHDWSDEHCVKILKICYDALPINGKVIVLESVISTLPEKDTTSKLIAFFDVAMMSANKGGKERTKQEFIKLATEAGFSDVRFKCFVFGYWVMEFVK